MKRLPLRTRLTLWFGGSILLILTPVLVGILVLEWRSMHDLLDHHLQEDLEVATQMLVARGPDLAWRLDSNEDPGYDAGRHRWVEVYARNSKPLFRRGLAANPAIAASLPSPATSSAGFRSLQTPAGAHVRTLTALRRLGGNEIWVRVARSEDPLRRELWRLVALFSIGAPLAVLAAAVAGHIIAGRALAPLVRMADRARSISAEHLSERLPIENAGDELGRLATVFNETFARLEASFDQLKRFTADASHQLRTPLTAIRSVGEVGLRSPRHPEGYREIIGSMLEEVDRLSRLVETLLTLSRWESGRVRPVVENLDLAAVARDVAGQLSVLAEERGIAVAVDLPQPVAVACDPMMARQAIVNVLDNAIKFTRDHGTVRIWARSRPNEHDLIVDDEGPGIPGTERDRVLERFYRVSRQPNSSQDGAGLGLSIVHWAITANRGRIGIETSPTGGTRLILSLPRFPAGSSATA